MNRVTKFLAAALVLVVLMIPTSVLLSKFIFTTNYSYNCDVGQASQGQTKHTVIFKIESVKYPWGQGHDVLRLQDDLYASYDPNQYLMISDQSIFASQDQHHRLKTVSFDRQAGRLIFQEVFQSNGDVVSKSIFEGQCSLKP